MQNVLTLPITHKNHSALKQKSWSYLLADSLAFNKEVDYGIRIQKPCSENIPKWIEKIVVSGQCSSIYVENLKLKKSDKLFIEGLCHKHNVSLFSISVVKGANAKVVQGPW
ncbi:hypothetical protein J3L16_08490 [Alteromonas sp. 5E99-2]|uniref:hypothetical protein n=1 Tax=Alteromonas sp. 5E99-2 TaxID=2817683 RepID=UPI001A9812D4|nr:hypothetical protein [Alteromonas sp. 5E99-2]MBO1255720.1 hypothetical protein [Alteromonas sp. 5E99-2]